LNCGILLIAKRSIDRVKQTIRSITRRNAGKPLEEVIKTLNLKVPGWVRYFKMASCKHLLRGLDQWIRRKLRCIRLKQLKQPYTTMKFLRQNGVPEWNAWILAGSGKGWWRKSSAPQASMAMSNKWFEKLGLVNLEKLYLSL